MNQELDISKIYEVKVKGGKMYAPYAIIETIMRDQLIKLYTPERLFDQTMNTIFASLPCFDLVEKFESDLSDKLYLFKSAKGRKQLFEQSKCGKGFQKAAIGK